MNKQNQDVKKAKLDVIDWLVEMFPAAFSKKAKHVKPLKIGIFDDIIDFYERLDTPPFSKKLLREAINYYSGSPAYLSSQKPNTERVDLFGNGVDIVNEEQARYAEQRYKERFAKEQASK